MRLPRYITARSTTAELRSAVASDITPVEAAAAQVAKFGAISSVADSIGEAVGRVQEVRQRAQDAEDRITAQINESTLKAEYQALRTDPNLKKDVQDDGTPTAEYFQKKSDELFTAYRAGLDQIKNPQTREYLGRLIKAKETEYRADVQADLGIIDARVAGEKLNRGLITALNTGDMEGGDALISGALEDGLLDAMGAEKWRETFRKQGVENAAQDYISIVDDGFAISEEEGQKRLAELIKDKSIDPDIKNKAVDGAEEKAVEWGKARAREAEQQEVQAILNFGDYKQRADVGDLTFDGIDKAYESGDLGEGTGAAQRRNQLYEALDRGTKAREEELDVGGLIQSGMFIPDDKKSRDALSRYEATVTNGMDGREAIRAIADISRTAGTVSTQTEQLLNLAGKSESAAAQVLPLYRELTADKSLHPSMHLKPEAESFLEDASTLIDAGVGQAEAITTAWGNKNIKEPEKIERAVRWKDEGIDVATNGYTDLINSDWYEEPGWGDIEAPDPMMQTEYGMIFKKVFEQTGNLEAAKNIADRSIKQTWVMTNFNSPDKKEYSVMKFGIPGDASKVRESIITDLSAEKFRIRQDDGTYKTAGINPDKITFETPVDRADAFATQDNQKFIVLHDGVPLTRVTDNGLEIASITIDKTKIDEFNRAMAKKEMIDKRIKEIDRQERELTAEPQANQAGFTAIGSIPMLPVNHEKRNKKLTTIRQEREKLKAENPMGIHF